MHIVVALLLFCGLIFFFGGAVGIVRFPDFYTRLHPAGKLDTAGLAATMGGIALYTAFMQNPPTLHTALKIILIVVFVFITSPTATHAMLDAGSRAGLEPWRKESQED